MAPSLTSQAESDLSGEKEIKDSIARDDWESLTVEERAQRVYRGVLLAPMVRASTTPLRSLALRYGADAVYTEELIDRSLSATIRQENEMLHTIDYLKDESNMSQKSVRKLQRGGNTALLLRIDPALEQRRLICQMGSGEPELALKAALHVHRDVTAIDVNMGCPKKFSVSGGMGSALLSDVDRACRIVKTLSSHLYDTGTPVSAKIRLLKDTAQTVDFITALIEAGAKAVAVHGRRVGDDATKPADWDTLREVLQLTHAKYPSVPLMINGDFYTRDEFTNFMQETGASGVLLARPALYNTSLVRPPPPPSPTAADGTAPSYGYKSPLLLDKTLVVQEYLREAIRYDAHHKNVKYVICEMMSHRRAPSPRVPMLPMKFSGGQTIGTTCACHSLEDLCRLWKVDYNLHLNEYHSKGAQSVSTQSTGDGLAGEHKYLDSYFLGSKNPSSGAEEGRDTKRARVET